MNEKILNIEEVVINPDSCWEKQVGYMVTTDQQQIKVLIDGDQSCCEVFGYFSEPDDLKDMVQSFYQIN
jgi:hypothetical protein